MAEKIWTIESRGNVLLDVISQYFNLTPQQMQSELWHARAVTVGILSSKGVRYDQLRSALTPRRNRYEFAFVFDSMMTGGTWNYVIPAIERLLPLLPAKDFSCSFLSGDLLIEDQELGFTLLNGGIELHREVRELHQTGELFAIYINNLTTSQADTIHHTLLPWAGYVGRIPCTYSTATKDWLSTTLSSKYVKWGRTFICLHEDDVDNDKNYNLPGWPIEDFGYRCVSLQAMYYDLLLSYKIERRVIPGETDTAHALSAISGVPMDLGEFRLEIDESKLKYIAAHKGGGFRAAGLHDLDRTQVEEMLHERIGRNYIYELELKKHDEGTTSKFNIMLELPRKEGTPVRMQATIEYVPSEKTLRVITLY